MGGNRRIERTVVSRRDRGGDRVLRVECERQVRRRIVEQFDPLAFGREHVRHPGGRRVELEPGRGNGGERLHPERHVIHDGPLSAALRLAFTEEHQHVRECHHHRLTEGAGLTAKRFPEPLIGRDVPHVVVQVPHGDTGLVGRRQLRRGRRGRTKQQEPRGHPVALHSRH